MYRQDFFTICESFNLNSVPTNYAASDPKFRTLKMYNEIVQNSRSAPSLQKVLLSPVLRSIAFLPYDVHSIYFLVK